MAVSLTKRRAAEEDAVVPHDLVAERAVLGAVLLHPEAIDRAMGVVGVGDFFRVAHGWIFGAMAVVRKRGPLPDFVMVRDELRRGGRLDEAGGESYLAGLTDGLPIVLNIEAHAGVVREKARLRAVAAAANRLAAAALGEEDEGARLVERAVHELGLCVDVSGAGAVTELDAIHEYLTAMADEVSAPVPTGFVDLDTLVGGIRGGDLVIVAARPSVGKSSFALGIAYSLALSGRSSLFCSLEMNTRALASRLLAWQSGVPSARLERGTASDDDVNRMAAVRNRTDKLPLYIEASVRTVAEVGAWARKLKREQQLACVVVDYLQLLTAERQRDNDEAEVASVVKDLKRLATDVDIPVVALSQLNRAPETRRDKRPHVSDLRGSGVIEQACDMAFLLFREEMYRPKPENLGIAECIVGKNRNGPVGVVRLQFTKELAQFHNLAQ